jgi:uncharacterized protein YkwD
LLLQQPSSIQEISRCAGQLLALTRSASRRAKPIGAALAALACLAALNAEPATAQNTARPTEQPALLQALNEVRSQGCGGKAHRASALLHDPRLSATAARVADGTPLAEALKASAYRSPRTTLIALKGFTGEQASAQGAASHSCGTLMDSEFKESGFFARGSQVWIVLAVPFAPPDAAEADQIEASVLALVNEARGQARMCGSAALAAAQPVKLNARLRTASADHADEMARLNYFGHTGRDGLHVFERASRTGYAWRAIGENIASGQMQAEAAVQGWLKSPSHCANLMMPGYTDMGLAFAVNPQSEGGVYWVQVFGLPR